MRRKVWLLLALLLAVSVTNTAWAQEEQEEDPPVLRLSFYMCDLSGDNGEQIQQEIENQDIPVWEELVSEDRGIEDYGYIVHSWADEWNIGIYTIGESIQAIVEAAEEAGNRLEERHGDGPSAFAQACPHHKDGFYTMGPSTGTGQE